MKYFPGDPLLSSRQRCGLMLLCSVVLAGCSGQSPQDDAEVGPSPEQSPAPATEVAILADKRVLLVHSYHKEYEWVAQVTRGVKRSFEKTSVQLEMFHMNMKQRGDEAWKTESGNAAAAVVEQWDPDVVIVADDCAQEHFARRYVGRHRPQIVFCGVTGDPSHYGYPASNATGVVRRPNFEATLRLLQLLVPDARRIAVITDNSTTSGNAIRYMREHGGSTEVEVVCWDTPDTFDEWQHSIERVQDSVDAIAVYLYHTVAQPDSLLAMEPREVMAWTVENSKVPVLGFFAFAVDDGALCGMVESGVDHGLEAGNIALSILSGKTAADHPIGVVHCSQSVLNRDSARRLDIEVPEHILAQIDLIFEKQNSDGPLSNP